MFFWGIGALLITIPINADTKREIESVRIQLEVTDVRTVEQVTAYLYEATDKIVALQPEAAKYLEAFKTKLAATGSLSSGEISEMVKLKQANGLLNFYDYTIPVLLLVLCGLISIFLAYKLKRADKRQGFGLELPSKKN